ncbi:MAG: lipid-A-disaccharide synthase, partial [Candidatus Eremiobacteraeota bacterium]|nr:lipid-A-disaccharide synthase [Candidatus Eremiobacteraeota bacterium]
MRLIVTCNGPGETAGWLRPLLLRLYERKPDADVHVFFVPDDYATGREPAYVRSLFPQTHVYDVRAYLRVALGAHFAGAPSGAEAVLYLGG